MIFFIISTHKSQRFTEPSIHSLFGCTALKKRDRIIVVDNDNTLGDVAGVAIIHNDQPQGFARNANRGIDFALERADDIVIMNNDIIYTKYWLDYMDCDPTRISVPFCNQDAAYEWGSLRLKFVMDYEDYADRQDDLNRISSIHRERRSREERYARDILIPFFCAHIPLEVLRAVGKFDESFGRGGGEDVDYRLRAIEGGVDVAKVAPSYVLHFMGKSTWRSGEKAEETRARNSTYRNAFADKWGVPVAELFLVGGNKAAIADKYGVGETFRARDYGAILRALSRRER
jgi:GT2 family glycosyltransferase